MKSAAAPKRKAKLLQARRKQRAAKANA